MSPTILKKPFNGSLIKNGGQVATQLIVGSTNCSRKYELNLLIKRV